MGFLSFTKKIIGAIFPKPSEIVAPAKTFTGTVKQISNDGKNIIGTAINLWNSPTSEETRLAIVQGDQVIKELSPDPGERFKEILLQREPDESKHEELIGTMIKSSKTLALIYFSGFWISFILGVYHNTGFAWMTVLAAMIFSFSFWLKWSFMLWQLRRRRLDSLKIFLKTKDWWQESLK